MRKIQFLYILTLYVATSISTQTVKAQTPVANRVHASAANLPANSRIVAKYTDNKRHCLYYCTNERLYRYDVVTDKTIETSFSDKAYKSIKHTFLSTDSRYIFVDIDLGQRHDNEPETTHDLWRIDTFTNKYVKIGSGYKISRHKDSLSITAFSRCCNPNAPVAKQKWMVRDHYYYLTDGKTIFAKEEQQYHP